MNYNNKLFPIWLISLSSCIFCSGCSKLLKKVNPSSPDPNEKKNYLINNQISNNNMDQINQDQNIEDQLVTAAKSIEKSLATLAASQEINNIPILNTGPLITPEGGMGHTADIDWTGPIEPLLQKIASLTNYNLKILGKPSPIPIIISITQSKAIIADILKNASLQAGNRVNIVVFPANRIIELRYKFGSYNNVPKSHDNN